MSLDSLYEKISAMKKYLNTASLKEKDKVIVKGWLYALEAEYSTRLHQNL